jgi:diadenosine tetraphosphate (Ap4A) HIT family hydrolase
MTTTIYQLNQFEVKVDVNPIGGYRGKIGALSICHIDKKVMTDWNLNDLQDVAKLMQTILKIQENNNVHNTLIFARQDKNCEFKLSLVPYPKCNWFEKIQGLIHVIFGCPTLKEHHLKVISQFYETQFAQKVEIPYVKSKPLDGKPDAFCKPNVIESQKIADLTSSVDSYYLLYDKRPKGASKDDPHFLMVPKGEGGHCDGSEVPEDKRFDMLLTVQKAMNIFLEEGFSTLLYLERNGSQLQGVKHKHSHVQGIKEFPKSFFAKLMVLIRQIFPSALSEQDLKNRIQHYQVKWETYRDKGKKMDIET